MVDIGTSIRCFIAPTWPLGTGALQLLNADPLFFKVRIPFPIQVIPSPHRPRCIVPLLLRMSQYKNWHVMARPGDKCSGSTITIWSMEVNRLALCCM